MDALLERSAKPDEWWVVFEDALPSEVERALRAADLYLTRKASDQTIAP